MKPPPRFDTSLRVCYERIQQPAAVLTIFEGNEFAPKSWSPDGHAERVAFFATLYGHSQRRVAVLSPLASNLKTKINKLTNGQGGGAGR